MMFFYLTKLNSYFTIAAFMVVFSQATIAQLSKCDVIQDGIDLQTKTYRIELAPSLLFNHTPPEVKNDLQEENLIQCQAQIVKTDDQVSLHLNLRINSQKATSVYGEIEKEHKLKIILIDGREIVLYCYAGSKGVLTQDRKAYIYPLGYHLSKREMKALSKKEIDKIALQWSSGMEEYVIYELDFLMNQLTCLNQTIDQKPN